MRVRLAILMCCLMILPGCVVIRVTARNPIPEMTTIAIAPFFNLTQEPNSVVDGRRFALAYYAELQKTQGFEVIPIGITEAAILEHRLELQNPEDALKLCRILNADAIVVGAVTDYEAYYPPRIGMQVDWYSPYEWALPTKSAGLLDGTQPIKGLRRMQRRAEKGKFCDPVEYRGQSPEGHVGDPGISKQPFDFKDDLLAPPPYVAEEPEGHSNVPAPRLEQVPVPADLPMIEAPEVDRSSDDSKTNQSEERGAEPGSPPQGPTDRISPTLPLESGIYPEFGNRPPENLPAESAAEGSGSDSTGSEESGSVSVPGESTLDVDFDPTQPLMSYTRMFDGSEAELVNKLRDYLELRGDRRKGSWEEYLHRSEDFMRFVSHVMIVEMLSIHGGANRTQIVFKLRKYR